MTDNYFLSRGRHHTAVLGRCAMEFVAALAGEPHTDRPECVSWVLRVFCTRLNDSLNHQERQKLRPYLARCIGTAGDGLDTKRAWMCTDLLIREFVPAWLELAGLDVEASRLRALTPVISDDAARIAQPHVAAASRAVDDPIPPNFPTVAAARARAWAACLAACGMSPSCTARDANSAASLTVDRAAAHIHTRTTLVLAAQQQSLFNLLDRMLPTVPVELPADRQQIASELAG